MPKKYKVTLSDGRSFAVTTEGGPPSEQDVMGYLGQQKPTIPTEAPTPTSLAAQGGNAGPIPRAQLAASLATATGYPTQEAGQQDTPVIQRYLEGTLGTAVNAAKAVGQGLAAPPQGLGEEIAANAPPFGLLGYRAASGAVSGGLQALQRAKQAYEATQSPVAAVGQAIQGIPVLGAATGGIQQAMNTGNLAGAAGQAVANLGLMMGGGQATEEAAAARQATANAKAEMAHLAAKPQLGKILGATTDNWTHLKADMDAAIPVVLDTAGGKKAILSSPNPIGQFKEAAAEAARQEAKHTQALLDAPGPPGTPGSFRDMIVDPSPLVGSLKALAKQYELLNPGYAKKALAQAERFEADGPITIGNVYKNLVTENAQLSAINNKNPGQYRITVADPKNGWRVAVQKGLKDLLYSNVPDEVRASNQLQGAIANIRDRAEIANNAAELWTPPSASKAPTAGEATEAVLGGTLQSPHLVGFAGGRYLSRQLFSGTKTPNASFVEQLKNTKYGNEVGRLPVDTMGQDLSTMRQQLVQSLKERVVPPEKWDELDQMMAGTEPPRMPPGAPSIAKFPGRPSVEAPPFNPEQQPPPSASLVGNPPGPVEGARGIEPTLGQGGERGVVNYDLQRLPPKTPLATREEISNAELQQMKRSELIRNLKEMIARNKKFLGNK